MICCYVCALWEIANVVGIFCEECIRAARTLSSLEWNDIRREKFHVTPEGLFTEIVRNAEAAIQRTAEEEKRREEWLADVGEQGEEDAGAGHKFPLPGMRADKFGCDLDKFLGLSKNRPPNWRGCVTTASWIQIDEMRPITHA